MMSELNSREFWWGEVERNALGFMRAVRALNNPDFGISEEFSGKLKQAEDMVGNAYIVLHAEKNGYSEPGFTDWEYAKISQE